MVVPGPGGDGVSKVYDTGTVVRYNCDKDRVLFGPGVRECLEDGSWSGTIPICSRFQ